VLLYAFTTKIREVTSLLRGLCNYYEQVARTYTVLYTNWYRYNNNNNTLIHTTATYYICIYNLKGCDESIFLRHIIIIYTILSCNILCFYVYTQYAPCMTHNDESDFSTRSHDFFGKAKKEEKNYKARRASVCETRSFFIYKYIVTSPFRNYYITRITQFFRFE